MSPTCHVIPTLIVIEDNPVLMGLIIQFLEKTRPPCGHVIATARQGKAGIEAVSTRQPTAVIVDVVLSDMAGIEVVGRLRRQYPGLVIIGFSNSPELFGVAALGAGADAFVSTESLRTELPAALKRSIGRHEAVVATAMP